MRVTSDQPTPTVRVYGIGCPRCRTLAARTREALDALKIDTPVEVIDDMWQIAEQGITRVPTLAIDDRVILAGRVPRVKKLITLIEGAMDQ